MSSGKERFQFQVIRVTQIFTGAEPGIFVWGGPSATLIHLLRQLPHTCIYTYARFFIIYTHFLFDKLYIYTQKKGV